MHLSRTHLSVALATVLLAMTCVSLYQAPAVIHAETYRAKPAEASAPETVPGAIPVSRADAACARCHAAIVQEYERTPHAIASGIATEKLIPGWLTQPASGVTYTVTETKGEALLTYRDPANPSLAGSHRLDYYLGSGHLGVTYLYSVSGYLLESPIAYYTHIGRYDMKPGLAGVSEGAPAIPLTPECLRCHMSGVEKTDAGSLNHYTGAPFHTGGIACESCHGDASAHMRSGGKAPVLNPAKLTADRRDSICISCHLEGDVSVEKNNRSALDFHPGDAISEDLAYFVYGHAGATARGVSEVEQFAASRCKRASGDSMSCTTCHDPHFVPAPAQRVTYYRAKCLSCHGVGDAGVAFAATHHPENPDCTSCHMPRSTAENIPHVAWTDHRILARPDPANATAPAAHSNELVPIFSPDATPRDLALAYYAAVMHGHTEDGAQACSLLTASFEDDAKDVQVINALATLADAKGDAAQAGRLFAEVLTLDPKNSFAATDLAVLNARNGRLREARTLLQPVFERNQDVPSIAVNLAAVECLQGDGKAAQSTLETALRYSPGSHDLQRRLARTAACGIPSAP
jgi:predicted CXXCH cytochrome family protein